MKLLKKSSLKLGNRSLMCNPSLINGIMVWVLSTLHFPPLLLSLLTQSAWKQPFQSLASMKSVPENLQCSCNGNCDNCTNQEKNCHYWNWQECLFWDGASTVLAESSIMLLMFVLELQFNRKLLLRKRRSDYEEFSFQVGFPCLKLFITMRLEKLGEKSYW